MAIKPGRTSRIDSPSPHRATIWAGIYTIVILGGIIAFKLLGDSLYDYPNNPDLEKMSKNTLITCLAGGKGRIDAALNLFIKDNGAALFIAGAGPSYNRARVLSEYLTETERMNLDESRANNIFVETQSRNTIENAYAISQFLQTNPHIDEVVVLTSAYHMKRSLLILESAIGKKVILYPYVHDNTSIHKDNWLSSWNAISVTYKELGKLALAKLFVPNLELF